MFNVDASTIEAEKNGVWAEYQGSQLLIAHINNPIFQREYSKLQVPHRKDILKNRLDPNIMLHIMVKSLAKGVLLDWKDVVDGKGNNVQYTRDLAEKVLRDNTPLREFVIEFATDISQYEEEVRKELGKVSGKSSSGTSSGAPESTS